MNVREIFSEATITSSLSWRVACLAVFLGTPALKAPVSPFRLALLDAALCISAAGSGGNGPGRSRTSAHGFEVRRSIH